jgi:hypothetical protein
VQLGNPAIFLDEFQAPLPATAIEKGPKKGSLCHFRSEDSPPTLSSVGYSPAYSLERATLEDG